METVLRNSPCLGSTEKSGERKRKIICGAAQWIYKNLALKLLHLILFLLGGFGFFQLSWKSQHFHVAVGLNVNKTSKFLVSQTHLQTLDFSP